MWQAGRAPINTMRDDCSSIYSYSVIHLEGHKVLLTASVCLFRNSNQRQYTNNRGVDVDFPPLVNKFPPDRENNPVRVSLVLVAN